MYIIYKTATTGFWDWKSPLGAPTQPRMCGISWGIFDESTCNLTETVKHRVCSLPKSVSIPQEALRVHGISHEVMDMAGMPIDSVLDAFLSDWRSASFDVGFNLPFDLHIISNELVLRSRATLLQERSQRSDFKYIDLMEESKPICNIVGSNGELKMPKLIEAYETVTRRHWGLAPSLSEQVCRLNDLYIGVKQHYGT